MLLGRMTRFAKWTTLVAVSGAIWMGPASFVAWAQDDLFEDDLSGTTSSADSDNFFDSDSGSSGLADPTMADREQLQAQFQERVTRGQQLLVEKNWAGALEAFQSAAELAPTSAYVLLGQGIAHAELGSPDLAINALTSALIASDAPNVPGITETVNLYLGRMYLETGRYREAQTELAKARQASPNNPEANMYFGKAALRLALTSSATGGVGSAGQAQITQAIQALKQAIDLNGEYGEAYLERGRALQRIRQVDFAIEDLEQAVRYLGATSEAGADLGIAYIQRAASEAVQPDADSTKILNDLRAAISTLDQFLAAAQLGQRTAPWETIDLLTQSPDDVMLSRADAKIKLGDELNNGESGSHYESAIADAQRILDAPYASDDLKGRAYYYQGLAHRMNDRLDAAVETFTQAILTNSLGVISEAYLRRGICYFHQGKLQLAEMDFESAASNPQNPLGSDPRAMMWHGIARAEQGDYNEAIRSYTRAVRYAPRYITAYLNRGLAYMNVGRYERAIEDFDTVLRQDPSNSQASAYRAQAEQQGKL